MTAKTDPLRTLPGMTLLPLLFFLLLLLSSCSDDTFIVEPIEEQNHEFDVILDNVASEEHNFRVVRILDNLNNPINLHIYLFE